MKGAIFGDSLLRSLYRQPDGHRMIYDTTPWLERIAAETGIELTNHSQIGSTVERGRMLFEKAVAKGLDAELILLDYGGNDADHDWVAVAADPEGEHPALTPIDRFYEAYDDFIARIRQLGMTPVMILPTPFLPENYIRFLSARVDAEAIRRYLVDINYMYRQEEAYAFAMTKIARKNDCFLIDMRTPLLNIRDIPSVMSMDGIHPLPEAYDIMWQTILDGLKEWQKENAEK